MIEGVRVKDGVQVGISVLDGRGVQDGRKVGEGMGGEAQAVALKLAASCPSGVLVQRLSEKMTCVFVGVIVYVGVGEKMVVGLANRGIYSAKVLHPEILITRIRIKIRTIPIFHFLLINISYIFSEFLCGSRSKTYLYENLRPRVASGLKTCRYEENINTGTSVCPTCRSPWAGSS